MKILYILDLYIPHIGGVETLFQHIIEGVVGKGHEAIILTTRHDKSLPKKEEKQGITIYRVGTNRYNFMFFSFFLGIKIGKNVDFIHTTTYNAAIPARLISCILRKKIILTVHEIFGKLWYEFMGWRGFFFLLFERLVFAFSYDAYICVSNYTKNSLRITFRISDKKLYKIYNGIDYNLWNQKNIENDKVMTLRNQWKTEGKYVGLFFGRPGVSKGAEYFIKAIPNILESISNFRAILVIPNQDTKRFEYIQNCIQQTGKEEFIKLIPGMPSSELIQIIGASDVIIVPSLAEGFGFAAGEVCAMGKPIVVSEIASLPEVVSGKVYFSKPTDSESIARGVMKVFSGEYEHVPEKRFLWEDTIEHTLEVYKQQGIGKND